MTVKDNFQNLSEEQKHLAQRILDLALGRALKTLYLQLDETNQKSMENVFLSSNKKEKENFLKKHLKNFKTIFEREIKELENEIKAEIKK